MKIVILAGGQGTRLSEETGIKPKPMVEIGGKPILWHIMKIYSHYGFNDFVICLGYKGYMIKEYFANYLLHTSDVTIDMVENSISTHKCFAEPWRVSLIDTGEDTMTGGRVKRIQKYVDDETFMLTYGDGLCDVDINHLLTHHKQQKKIGSVTAIQPAGKFGAIQIDGNMVTTFQEKPKGDRGYVSGGFFVFEPEFFDYLKDDTNIMEQEPLMNLSRDKNLTAYRHSGFWQSMDTIHDKVYLESLWASGKAPWKIWK